MDMNRVVISGATGEIGTALTQLLVNKGADVLVLTRPNSERNDRIITNSSVHVLQCDYDHLDEIQNDTGVVWDCFFHFAWAGTSGEGRNDMYLQNRNVHIALDAVKLAKRFGCRKYVGAGSQAEYGRHNSKLTSDTPVFPEMGYGYAKLCAGYMTRDLAHQLGMEHNWLRILSVYGENDGKNAMLRQLIECLKKGESPELTKGEQIWDYLYNKDAALAFYLTAERGIDGKVYVVGSGQERKLSEYLTIVRDLVAPGIALKLGARAYGDRQVMYLAADNTEIYKDTGFKPKYSFEQGIQDMIGHV